MYKILQNELKSLAANKYLLFMYFIMPFLLSIFIFSTLRESTIKNLPIGIVDLDKTTLSRDIAFNIDSAPTLNITNEYHSVLSAKNDLSTKKIYALIVLPKDLERSVKTNLSPQITIYYNTQLVLIGKNINNALLQVSSNINARLNFIKNIPNDKNTLLALGDSVDFMPKIVGLYNENSNYMQFLLTAILPCLWQLLIILCMIGILAQDETFHESHKSRFIYTKIFVKMAINTAIFFGLWILMTSLFYKLSYPMNGDFWILSLNAIVLILAYNCIGLFIYSIISAHTRAISVATVYAAPSLAFVGVTYPINNMNEFAIFWGQILPITKYLQVYIQQANYGLDAIFSLKLIVANLIFLLFGILGAMIYQKKFGEIKES